jgi:hypothetical protein
MADGGNCCLDVNFASLRPATTDLTAGKPTRSTMLDFGSKELGRTVSGTRSHEPECRRQQRRTCVSQLDFVAKDFTNHFSLNAQSIAIVQKSALTRPGQGSVSQKRVVVNYTFSTPLARVLCS